MKLKKVLVMLLVVALIPALTLSLSANGKIDKPRVIKGAETLSVQGWTRSWKDTKKITLDEMMANRKLKQVLNFRSPRTIKRAPSADKALDNGSLARKSKAMSSPIIDFAGMSLSANGAGWPPDTCGDVGPNHYVQAVNTSIGIYNKSTGTLVSATTFDSFFGGSAPCTADNNGDPIVLYDRYNQRWFILDFAWSSTSGPFYYSVAASQTSDPTGSWWQYCFQADSSLLNDYPKSGVWHDGIYTTANMFTYSSGSFQHVKVWAFKTPDIYTGTLTSQSLTDTSNQAWSLLPTNSISATASTGPNYMYAVDANEYGGSAIDAIYVWKYNVDWNTPANTTWTGHSTMNVAAYGLTASRIPQSGTSTQLDSLYGRLMYPANYRNFGTHESVYLNHVAESGGKRVTRWYEIRINSGTSSIYQQSTYDPDSIHRWMGSIAADKNGNIALAYSASNSSMKPAIRYSGRLSTDPLNQLSQGEASMIEGTGHQTSYTRWGDYSHLTIDPDDDETFWYTTEYYSSSGTNWQTRIGSFKIATTPDTTPPVISNVASGSITASSATITWDTDEAATSTVEYGLTTSYGSTETVAGLSTSHSVGLSGLSASTTYHYRVVSEDASSNSASSGDFTFTTSTPDTTPPVISNVSSGSISDTSATITWTTNEAADSLVDYGTTTSYGSSESSGSLVTSHSIQLTGLSANTLYHYQVTSEDASANSASSGDFTFTTDPAPSGPEMLVYQLNMSTRGSNRARCRIRIRNDSNQNVSGASVSIAWTGASTSTQTKTTNGQGRVTFVSGTGSGTFTCTVTSVTHSSYTYNPALNPAAVGNPASGSINN